MGKDMSVERLTQRLSKTLQNLPTGNSTHESEYNREGSTHESVSNTEGSTFESHYSMVNSEMKVTNNQSPGNENKSSGNICVSPAVRKGQNKYQHFSVELMAHPGFACPDLENGGCGTGPDEFARSEERCHEMKVLNSEDFQDFLTTAGFEKHFSVQQEGT